MKKDIHPEYVETTVTCTCGNTFTTRSTAELRQDPRRGLLAVPPVLHGQAEDPRHRWPRGPLRGPLRQEGRSAEQRPLAPPTPPIPQPRVGRRCVPRSPAHVRRPRRAHGARASEPPVGSGRCSQEYADLERRAGRPRRPRRPGPARDPEQAVCRARPDRRGSPRAGRGRATTSRRHASWHRGRRRSPPRCPRSRRPSTPPRRRCVGCSVPRDPDDDRDVILEVKAGEGGEESALFAGDLLRMYLRYAERRGWKTEVIDATESDLGGYKDVRIAVKAKGSPGPARRRGPG